MKITKTHIILISIVLVLFVALSFFFYYKGKKTVTTQVLPDDLPGGQTNNTNNGSTGASNFEIKTIAEQLHEDMDGFNWAGHNYEPYERALVLSNTDLVKLYNTFNSLYQASSGETLKQWIESEQYASNTPDLLLNRFASLNLI